MMCTHGGVDYHHRLVIHPRHVEVALVEQLGRVAESADPVRGAGVDISGIREWRPGDSSGSVHWRSSARRGTLVVRERGSAATRHVAVVLACSSSAPDWEDVLSVAASACLAAQRAGHRLSLLVWTGGSLASPPVDSAEGLLDWWAELRASELPDPAALSRVLASTGTADLHVAVSATMSAGPLEEIRRACAAAGGLVYQVTVAM
jgi:uncharacterized protein (DUF58 family)